MSPPSRWAVWANLWAVYLIWGSTYLAIRIAVETIPPFLGAGVRFLLAGVILAAILAARGKFPLRSIRPREILASGVVGALLLFGGNGLVMTAERTVPSGLAALLIASVPLWVIVLRSLDGQRISRATLGSVVVGFAGVALLVLPHATGGLATLGGPLLIVIASISWATGSFFSQRLPLPRDPLVSTSLQMFLGGLVLSAAGLVSGEAGGLDPARFSTASVLALAYLVVFGSLVAFSAYTWLLHHAPLSTVATYAYVNPVIAVFLGWAVLSEEITPLILGAALIIVASVALVVRQESLSRAPAGRAAQRQDHARPGAPRTIASPLISEGED